MAIVVESTVKLDDVLSAARQEDGMSESLPLIAGVRQIERSCLPGGIVEGFQLSHQLVAFVVIQDIY